MKQQSGWRLAGELLHGLRRYLFLGTFSVLCGTFLSYLIPMVSSFTIDYVIGGQAPSLPFFLESLAQSFADRERLTNNLAICAIVLVALTSLNGLFSFLRQALYTRTRGRWDGMGTGTFWGSTPNPGRGLSPLHPCFILLRKMSGSYIGAHTTHPFFHLSRSDKYSGGAGTSGSCRGLGQRPNPVTP